VKREKYSTVSVTDVQLGREYDYRLVRCSLDGDESAWEILYRDAYSLARWEACRCNGERIFTEPELADIVEEAFLRCWRRRADYLPVSRFATWLSGFVRYVALEEKRKRYCELSAYRRYSYAEPRSMPSPWCVIIRKERDFCLWLAFDSLSRVHRIILGCYVLAWYTPKEAKRQTGMSQADMQAEMEIAVRILRRRFLAAYCGSLRPSAEQ
jgi:DNA-directed RNA polymerase specialized sigma24 family protein